MNNTRPLFTSLTAEGHRDARGLESCPARRAPPSPAGTMEATRLPAFRIKGEKAEGHVTRVNTRVLPPRDTRADSARASASVVKLFIYRVSRRKGGKKREGRGNEGVERNGGWKRVVCN